ncbi:MAG: HlyD family secretion protein [Bacteroidota bacterium]
MEQDSSEKSRNPKWQQQDENPIAREKEGEVEESIETVPLYRNYKLVIPLFIALIAVIIIAWNWYLGLRDYVSTDDAYIDGYRVAISSKILGRIDSLTVDEGDTVRQGQVLVKIDASDLRSQEQSARASVTLSLENITLTKVTLDRSLTDYERASKQFHDNVITREQFEHAQSELAASRARYTIALAQTNTAKAQLGIIQTQLKNTIIESPMSGVVAKRWVLSGDVIQPGQSILSITDLKNIWVTANLEETSLTMLRLGDNVEIAVDAYPGRKFSGKVLQIGSNTASQFSLIPPNNASGNFTKVTQRIPVKISILPVDSSTSQPPYVLLPGMSVEVRVRVR